MKRPKSLPSRRQRALRRGVVLAVFLLAKADGTVKEESKSEA